MQKILRNYVIITSFLLCLTFLFVGIIGVNEETSYVISGERKDELRVQSTTTERLLVKEGSESKRILSFDNKDRETLIILLAGILPSPLAQIAWALA
ncbi:MAG: hypothetical protein E7555_09525 [Ruminococcaceae bacterium]|nr:hypothetical protein [Oscillospiraceae bacterium]